MEKRYEGDSGTLCQITKIEATLVASINQRLGVTDLTKIK